MANHGYAPDVSAFQPGAVYYAFWSKWRARGSKAGIVKLSEGTGWRNTYAAGQIAAIKHEGLAVAGYHFSRFRGNSYQAVNEAHFAIACAHQMGLPNGAPLILDYEERFGYRSTNTQAAIAFLKCVKAAGFVPVFYSYSGMASLWDYEAIYQATGAALWIAAYPTMSAVTGPYMAYFPQISTHTNAWQFTDNFYGEYIDGSIDLTGVFTGMTEKVTSGGHLDSVRFENNKLVVSGWAASDKTAGKPYHYIILTTENGHEVGRIKVDLTVRPDVTKAFPDIPGGGQSGFTGSFDYTPEMAQHKLVTIFRYTDDPAGNGNATDYVSLADLSKSAAYLDSMSVSFSKQLHVAGWFASDLSIGKPNRFAILFDVAANQELQRVKVDPAARPDVAKAQPAIYGSGQSGFNAVFDYDASLVGHKLQIIARYSDEEHGEGKYVDYWFDPFNGPSMPVLDGKTEQTFVAHDISVSRQQDGTLLVNAK